MRSNLYCLSNGNRFFSTTAGNNGLTVGFCLVALRLDLVFALKITDRADQIHIRIRPNAVKVESEVINVVLDSGSGVLTSERAFTEVGRQAGC